MCKQVKWYYRVLQNRELLRLWLISSKKIARKANSWGVWISGIKRGIQTSFLWIWNLEVMLFIFVVLSLLVSSTTSILCFALSLDFWATRVPFVSEGSHYFRSPKSSFPVVLKKVRDPSGSFSYAVISPHDLHRVFVTAVACSRSYFHAWQPWSFHVYYHRSLESVASAIGLITGRWCQTCLGV
jgi:hypothetical protein